MPLPLPLTSPFYFYQLSASSLRWQYDQEPFTSTAHCPKHLSINLLFKMAIAGHIATGYWCHLPFPRSTTLYWPLPCHCACHSQFHQAPSSLLFNFKMTMMATATATATSCCTPDLSLRMRMDGEGTHCCI